MVPFPRSEVPGGEHGVGLVYLKVRSWRLLGGEKNREREKKIGKKGRRRLRGRREGRSRVRAEEGVGLRRRGKVEGWGSHGVTPCASPLLTARTKEKEGGGLGLG